MSRLGACLDAMERSNVDVLMLGREANARTVSDASRLWLAGTRVFSPGCVVVLRSRAVHVLANTDAVVPAGFPVERLYGVTWNPEKAAGALGAIDGVRDALRIGVDGMSPAMSALLGRVAPSATLVDAGPLFAQLWSVPEPEKIAGVEQAAIVARDAYAAMVGALLPGKTPRELRGVGAAALAFLGTTTPAFEAVACPFGPGASSWLASERAFVEGEPVVVRAGALRDGWEASLARTCVCGALSTEVALPAGWPDLVAACVPGTTAGDLRAQGATVHGVGRGVEPWPDDLVLVAGLMVAVEIGDDSGLRQDVVRVTDAAPHVVTA